MLISQLGKYGLGGLTTGLHEQFPKRVLTFPVAEGLMNGAAFGLALAGMTAIVIHERMDFVAVGMDPLVNHIPIWPQRAGQGLRLVVISVVGKGKGQGPQHSKNLTPWFRAMDGWTVIEPRSPLEAERSLVRAAALGWPVFYVLHREAFGLSGSYQPPKPSRIGLCGASANHERAFYGQARFTGEKF